MYNKPKAIVILGPTAVGKSDFAVEIALSVSGEVISADSRQVYRGLDLGTGKITEEEMRGVPHHLLDIRNPLDSYNVVDFQHDAELACKDIESRGNIPILCGGTGFFITSITEGIIFPEAKVDSTRRQELESLTKNELFSLLQKLDSGYVKKVDQDNPRRLVRAIELAECFGNVPTAKKKKVRYEFLKIGLELPREELRARIKFRIETRLEFGMIEESQMLLRQGKLTHERMHSLGLEYRYISLYLQNKLTLEEFKEQLFYAIWHYARRQMTWFKREKDIQWFHPEQRNLILEIINTFL